MKTAIFIFKRAAKYSKEIFNFVKFDRLVKLFLKLGNRGCT